MVDADVKGGVFAGEKGDMGKPGWYSLTGKVRSDGTLELVARGIDWRLGTFRSAHNTGMPSQADWRAPKEPALDREAARAA